MIIVMLIYNHSNNFLINHGNKHKTNDHSLNYNMNFYCQTYQEKAKLYFLYYTIHRIFNLYNKMNHLLLLLKKINIKISI